MMSHPATPGQNPGHQPNYSWTGVMEFLQEQLHNAKKRENDWIADKKALEDRISNLESQLSYKDQEILSLQKKINLLELTLQQEKTKAASKSNTQSGHNRVKSDFITNIFNNHGEKIIAATSSSITSSIVYSGFDPKNFNHLINETAFGHVFPNKSSGNAEKPKTGYHKHSHSHGGMHAKSSSYSPHNIDGSAGKQNAKHLSPASLYKKAGSDQYNERFVKHSPSSSQKQSLTPESHSFVGAHSPKTSLMNNMCSPFFEKCSQNNNYVYNQNHSIYSLSNTKKSRASTSNVSNICTNYQGPIHIHTYQKNSPTQKTAPVIANERISKIVSSSRPSLNTSLTPNQKYSIVASTVRRRWLNAQATAHPEGVYSHYDVKRAHNPTSSMISVDYNRISIQPNDQSAILMKNNYVSEESKLLGKKFLHPKCTLRGHLDGVRGCYFASNDTILATISEDCTIKLWDVRKFSSCNDSTHIDPYYTIRYHGGPLFSITGTTITNSNHVQDVIFTAGAEGAIRVCRLPYPDEVNCYEACGNNNFCISQWNAHLDVIWELSHHPSENLMLSSSSDGSIKIWGTFHPDEDGFLRPSNGNILGSLCYKNMAFEQLDIPTSVCWLYDKMDGIIAGYVNSNHLVCFDREHGKILGSPVFMDEEVYTPGNQVNKAVWNPHLNNVITGHEDGYIRFFDMTSSTMIHSMVGHTDAVTCLSISRNPYYIATVGHDGSIRTWDTRKYQCVHELPAHKRKYDEGIHSIIHNHSLGYVATGGADGLVKIFQFFD